MRPQVLWRIENALELACKGDIDHADVAPGPEELEQVAEIALIGAEIQKGVNGNDRVEELRGEGQRMRVHLQWKYAGLTAQLDRAPPVVGGRGFDVHGPDLDPELTRHEDRTRGASTAQIQDPHAGAQRQTPCQALHLAQGVLAQCVVTDPLRIVLGRERE